MKTPARLNNWRYSRRAAVVVRAATIGSVPTAKVWSWWRENNAAISTVIGVRDVNNEKGITNKGK